METNGNTFGKSHFCLELQNFNIRDKKAFFSYSSKDFHITSLKVQRGPFEEKACIFLDSERFVQMSVANSFLST